MVRVRAVLWFALLCGSQLTFAACAGLHLKLTHVDGKEGCTDEERMRRAVERTHRRLASSRSARLVENQYFAEYLIGDPPQKVEAIVDTASSLVWTQTAACSVCFRQNLPRYDPSLSRTVRNMTCSDAACAAGLGSVTECGRRRGGTECFVHTAYNAFEEIAGDLCSDEFAFGSSSSEKVSLAFGCVGASSLTGGSLDGASGIVGLGRGPLSLASQLGEAANKFSYCLTPFFGGGGAINSSHLLVGASAVLSGGAAPVTSVPFVKNPKEDPYSTYYYLPLAGITVGKAKLDVPSAAFDLREVKPGRWAGTVVDSGTPFTSLVDEAYRALKAELEQQLGAAGLVRPPKTVLGRRLELCVARGDLSRLVPPMVLHFGGGDVVLPPENYWAPVGNETACMAVFSSAGSIRSSPRNETTVIGSFMQQNMQLLYDLGEGVLSFQPTDCSSFKPADPGRTGAGTGKKRSSSSASSSSSSAVPLHLLVLSLMSVFMLNGGAPAGVRGL